jgi:hypothetical protein
LELARATEKFPANMLQNPQSIPKLNAAIANVSFEHEGLLVGPALEI